MPVLWRFRLLCAAAIGTPIAKTIPMCRDLSEIMDTE